MPYAPSFSRSDLSAKCLGSQGTVEDQERSGEVLGRVEDQEGHRLGHLVGSAKRPSVISSPLSGGL